MKNTMTAAGISAAILAGGLTMAPAASADFSANIGVTSNYVWRGATQTGNGPAVQGGFDYASDIGIYVGTWVSNVNFGNEADIDGGVVSIRSGAESEVDVYAGWGMDFGDNLGIDLGYVYYGYTQNESGSNFGELYGSFNFWWFEVGVAGTVNDQSCNGADLNCTNDEDTGAFVAGDYAYWGKVAVPLGETWSIAGTLGEYKFTNDGVTIAPFEKTDYNYLWWQIDLTHFMDEYGDITMSVSQADKQADGNDSAKIFIGWTKGF